MSMPTPLVTLQLVHGVTSRWTGQGTPINFLATQFQLSRGNQVQTNPMVENVYCAGRRDGLRSELISEQQELYASAILSWDVNDSMAANFHLDYHNSKTFSNAGRQVRVTWDPYVGSPYMTLSKANAVSLGVVPADAEGEFFSVLAPVTDAPEFKTLNDNTSLAAVASLEGELNVDWAYQSSFGYASNSAVRTGENRFSYDGVLNEFIYDLDNWDGASFPSLKIDPTYNPLDPNRDPSLLTRHFIELETTLQNRFHEYRFLGGLCHC